MEGLAMTPVSRRSIQASPRVPPVPSFEERISKLCLLPKSNWDGGLAQAWSIYMLELMCWAYLFSVFCQQAGPTRVRGCWTSKHSTDCANSPDVLPCKEGKLQLKYCRLKRIEVACPETQTS